MKVIIVDDEPGVLDTLEYLLSADQDLEVLARCSSGAEATQAILSLRPDLVYIDVKMPDMGGFQVMEAVNGMPQSNFIFSSMDDSCAAKAFEKSAIDYLLKPFETNRFYASLKRAKKLVLLKKNEQQQDQFKNLLHLLKGRDLEQSNYTKRLTSKHNGKLSVISVDEIKFIEANGNFVHINTIGDAYMGNYTFKKLITMLDPEKFVQIHKSFIVNIDFIHTLEPYFHGDYILVLKEKTKLKVSRSFKEVLEKAIC